MAPRLSDDEKAINLNTVLQLMRRQSGAKERDGKLIKPLHGWMRDNPELRNVRMSSSNIYAQLKKLGLLVHYSGRGFGTTWWVDMSNRQVTAEDVRSLNHALSSDPDYESAVDVGEKRMRELEQMLQAKNRLIAQQTRRIQKLTQLTRELREARQTVQQELLRAYRQAFASVE